jgi:hypothetical protein
MSSAFFMFRDVNPDFHGTVHSPEDDCAGVLAARLVSVH